MRAHPPIAAVVRPALTTALMLLIANDPILAATCTVPGSHASIQTAVNDVTCDPIQLAARGYFESPLVTRSLSLIGAGTGATTLWGRLSAQGEGVLVFIDQLTVFSGCPGPALLGNAGASVRSGDVRAIKRANAGCNVVESVFSDGFE